MKYQKFWIPFIALLVGLSVILAACGPAPTATQSPISTPAAAGESEGKAGDEVPDADGESVQKAEAKIPDEAQEIVGLVKQDMAERQGITTEEIRVALVQASEWPDTGLGCPKPGRPALDVITPGYRIVLEAGSEQSAYHTGAGAFVLCPKSLQSDEPKSAAPGDKAGLNARSIPAVEEALQDLGERLGIAPEEIQVLAVQEMEWPDSSLGCPKPGMNYLMVITPGSLIQLEALGQVYQYHSGKGQVIYCENPKVPFGAATNAAGQVAKSAQADLAQRLGIPTTEIEVVQVEPVQWPDASLGCPQPGMMYAQMITPGFQITLAAGGQEYDYRATKESAILCEPAKE